ncbi:TIGR03862 family flavoprotein [Methylobrevis pamukkalensis]|uniref:Dihydropyrimidine dehydrogenase subunit A n=1 Tax=Methylobrevis pamukkalensis TaxID=1439726 RepID=A0A1E3H0L8_9HYPH|nr:TIGR03862 family flavoprotein [Methylobrevis pamukkalensis]ODN69859.1 dihydropyrimidine dehydrogenase subunit A [Methylobrevis pamukkalensis]
MADTYDCDVAIVGAGPAGLMAAELLSARGLAVTVFEAMPSVGRKLLLAGKGGLNLTHTEDVDAFVARYREAAPHLLPALEAFGPDAVRAWAEDLGVPTFAGSSGRVFPVAMKASPLLRAWLRRLGERGVEIRTRHRWTGFDGNGRLTFDTPGGDVVISARATLLALGGASWPRLGSNAAWVPILSSMGVAIRPLTASNCGFDVDWSPYLRDRFAGHPVKPVRLSIGGTTIDGEFVVTRHGIEGSAAYTLGRDIRDALALGVPAVVTLDLAPGRSAERLAAELSAPRGKASMASQLRKRAGIAGVKAALLRECADPAVFGDPVRLAEAIKALPLPILRPRPIEEAISSAGGIALSALDANGMLNALPGVFAAGEMLDWDAPTGGYLLTACLATGRAAAQGILRHLGAAGG